MVDKSKVGGVLLWIVAIILALSAFGKIFGMGALVSEFNNWGLGNFRILIGFIELALAILLVVPRTRIIGAFLVSGFFGGAIVTHMANPPVYFAVAPLVLLIVVLIGAHLKSPGIFSEAY